MPKKFEPVKDDLTNSYVKGDDCYPKTCEALMGMMRNFRAPRVYNQFDCMIVKDEDGLQFLLEKEASLAVGLTIELMSAPRSVTVTF